VLGFDAVIGNLASLYAAGSAYVLLHHAFGEVNGKSGAWGYAIGGMGAITQAMASAAVEHPSMCAPKRANSSSKATVLRALC
jgi:phytoene dehydrogenase-like protein